MSSHQYLIGVETSRRPKSIEPQFCRPRYLLVISFMLLTSRLAVIPILVLSISSARLQVLFMIIIQYLLQIFLLRTSCSGGLVARRTLSSQRVVRSSSAQPVASKAQLVANNVARSKQGVGCSSFNIVVTSIRRQSLFNLNEH